MRHKQHLFRRCFIAGLLVWLPIWATLLIIGFIIQILDKSLALLPQAYQPEALLGFYLPGLGLVLSVSIVFFTGLIVTNFLGRKLIALGEAIVNRIPLVRVIYQAVKQVLNTVFASGSDSFRKVLLVEYPRKGLWSIAFQTGAGNKEVHDKIGEETLTIFIPTTPNPTSGFLMMIPRKNAIELDMPIDEALKFVISLGVVQESKPNTYKCSLNSSLRA